MDVSKAITNRRAVKHFDPDHKMTVAEIEKLMSLVIQAPTAFNIQNWRFVLVEDPELRRQLRKVSFGQEQVTDASLLIILCADLKAWDQEPERYWRNTPPEVRDGLVGMIHGYYSGKERVQVDEAMRSCGMAAMTIMLAAAEMGYETCPMDGFDFEAVGKLIGLPEDHVIAMYVAVGKQTEEPHPRGGQLPMEEVVLENRFS
jgi:nitroreductase